MNFVFKERIKQLRKESNILQKDIAKSLGISPRAYRFYENGDRFPDFQGLIRLADFFDVSIDYLVGRTDNPKSHKN